MINCAMLVSSIRNQPVAQRLPRWALRPEALTHAKEFRKSGDLEP